MSSEMYSTNPSLMGAIAVGAPPWVAVVTGRLSEATVPTWGWAGLGIGAFLVAIAVWISWDVGSRGIVIQCPIITGIGVAIGFFGWMRAGNTSLLWGTGALFLVLVGVTFYAAVTKSLH